MNDAETRQSQSLAQTAGFSTEQVDALFALGQRAIDAGRLDQADAAFGVLLTLSPRQARGWRGMGETRLRLRDWGGALVCLTTALAIDGQDAASLAMRATALIELGREQMARDDLEACRAICEREGIAARAWREYTERLMQLTAEGSRS